MPVVVLTPARSPLRCSMFMFLSFVLKWLFCWSETERLRLTLMVNIYQRLCGSQRYSCSESAHVFLDDAFVTTHPADSLPRYGVLSSSIADVISLRGGVLLLHVVSIWTCPPVFLIPDVVNVTACSFKETEAEMV